jgi:DNA-directed RNA polymerase subunit RPC12/RpoP
MWIASLVYICTDCYSIVEIQGTPTAFKCWENL